MEVGYADLTIAAIADRAGTSKPAIYRRWPSKAHLVHEAAFPADDDRLALPDTGSLAERPAPMMLRRPSTAFADPVARRDHSRPDGRVRGRPRRCTPRCSSGSAGRWKGFRDRLALAAERGEVRADVDPDAADRDAGRRGPDARCSSGPPTASTTTWIDRTTDLLMRGIAP